MKQADLPIINLSQFSTGNQLQRQSVANQAIQACETSGFFYVTGHGIASSVFSDARQMALAFFRSPLEVKQKLHISHFPHHRGYIGNYDVSPDTSKGGDIREAFKVALELGYDDADYQAGNTLYGPNVWPEELPQFQVKIYQAYLAFQQLAADIFSVFALGLKLPADYFVPMTNKPASVMNVNYYPAADVSRSGETSGIGAHSDYEAFAMLWQDGVGGLQIESLKGEWQAVKPVQDTLIINIGDLMSHWTNDRFRATRHRVINISGKERVSLACFGNTNYHALIECIPSCCSEGNPAKYPPITSGEYLMDAVKRTYAYAN